MICPDKDGVDHINIFSKGKTELGKLLSNFANTPFTCSDGVFCSIEGLWYFLTCQYVKDDALLEPLRELHGSNAKRYGQTLNIKHISLNEDVEFRKKISKAIWIKINTHDKIKQLLINSTLPFKHYYVYYDKITELPQFDWQLKIIERYRTYLKDQYSNHE